MKQCQGLLMWAEAFPDRRGEIESAWGLGYLLAEQLVAAGEDVVDVPPTLSARFRVLSSGKAQKNDPNDVTSDPDDIVTLATAVPAVRIRVTPPT